MDRPSFVDGKRRPNWSLERASPVAWRRNYLLAVRPQVPEEYSEQPSQSFSFTKLNPKYSTDKNTMHTPARMSPSWTFIPWWLIRNYLFFIASMAASLPLSLANAANLARFLFGSCRMAEM
jgi:hypothetical protein